LSIGILYSQVFSFGVTSIKPSKAEDFRRAGIQFLPGGRLIATNYPLQVLISGAYHLPYQSPRLVGGPEWVRSDRFDLYAKADAGTIPSELSAEEKRARMRLMLQKLLADRFHLTLRRETKELPVYAMTVAKNGLKLPKSAIEEKDCFDESATVSCHTIQGGQGFGLHGKAFDLSDLAVFIENYTDRPVIDKTGIHELFQIETKGWVPLGGKAALPGMKAEDGSDLASLPSLFTIFGEFGLRLEPQKGPVEIFVIEHVERPGAN